MNDIDKEVNEAIKTLAKAKVAAALSDDILGELVDSVMKQKSGGYGDKSTFIERIINEYIEKALRSAVGEVMKERSDEIKSKVKSALNERTEAFATTIIDSFATDDWRAELSVRVGRDNYE